MRKKCWIQTVETVTDVSNWQLMNGTMESKWSWSDTNVYNLFHQSDPSSVPQLAWQFVPVQRTVNPVLAFSKGDTVHFLLVPAQVSNSEWPNPERNSSAYLCFLYKMNFPLLYFICFTFSGKKGGNGHHPCHQTKAAPSQLWHHQPLCKLCRTFRVSQQCTQGFSHQHVCCILAACD